MCVPKGTKIWPVKQERVLFEWVDERAGRYFYDGLEIRRYNAALLMAIMAANVCGWVVKTRQALQQ